MKPLISLKYQNKKFTVSKKETELIFVPCKNIKNSKILSTPKTKWKGPSLNQLTTKSKKSNSKKMDSFLINFTEGGSTTFIGLDNSDSYYRHSFLRKKISPHLKEKNIYINLEHIDENLQLNLIDELTSLTQILKWKPPKTSSKKETKDKAEKTNLYIYGTVKASEARNAFNKGLYLSLANNQVRTLSDTPANMLTPDLYIKKIQSDSKEYNFKSKVYSTTELKKMKAGAFLSVAQAAPHLKSAIVHLSYTPDNKAEKKVALVGKGICFDTGGYNVKTGRYMEDMQRDMTGSAVAYSLFLALIKLKAPYKLNCFLALTENHISPLGSKPSDVVTSLKGITIEVVNTDAEGRMALADTLTLASQSKPDLILDYATLTGAAVYCCDTQRAAIFSNKENLHQLGVQSGKLSGERTWAFPLMDKDSKALESQVADTLQCKKTTNADHIYAASFLNKFINNEPWVHMDLSCESNAGGLGLVPTSTTGFGVRWSYQFINSFFESEA